MKKQEIRKIKTSLKRKIYKVIRILRFFFPHEVIFLGTIERLCEESTFLRIKRLTLLGYKVRIILV